MKNKLYKVRIYDGKAIRIIYSSKIKSYFIEVNDLKKLLDIKAKDVPERQKSSLTYIEIKEKGRVKKLAGIAEDELDAIKNFSKEKDADIYIESIRTIIEDMKLSYSGYTKGMILEETEQDVLIDELERRARRINILEGQVNDLKMGAKLYYEFTGNTKLIPLKQVHERLKYKTTYDQLLAHLRQCGAINEQCHPTPALVENGCFRFFIWIAKIGDREKKTTQIVVSEKGIKYINEILEKANGKRNLK